MIIQEAIEPIVDETLDAVVSDQQGGYPWLQMELIGLKKDILNEVVKRGATKNTKKKQFYFKIIVQLEKTSMSCRFKLN